MFVKLLTTILHYFRCHCQSDCSVDEENESDVTSQFAMEQQRKIITTPLNTSRANQPGRKYYEESIEVRAQRASLASKNQEDGMSYKQAWFKAFQTYPREYVDVPLSPSKDSST